MFYVLQCLTVFFQIVKLIIPGATVTIFGNNYSRRKVVTIPKIKVTLSSEDKSQLPSKTKS